MMDYNAILLYLSEVGEGSWAQFKRAVASVRGESRSGDAANVARVMSALGHVEFAWQPEARWTICPPVLVILPRRPEPTAILCGQRPPVLLETLQTVAAQGHVFIEQSPQLDGPTVIQLRTTRWEALEQLADELHIRFVHNAAEYLASCLPELDALVAISPHSPHPVVPPINRFEPQLQRWKEVSQVNGDGLYQYENFYPDYRLFCDRQWRIVAKEIGIYTLLSPKMWSYNSEQQLLCIPKGLLPPVLFQRALVLSSGYLATFDQVDNTWVYRDVPSAIASALGRKLKQTL